MPLPQADPRRAARRRRQNARGCDRAGAAGALLRDQPGPVFRRHRTSLRPPRQSLLANAAQRGLHSPAAGPVRRAGAVGVGVRDHQLRRAGDRDGGRARGGGAGGGGQRLEEKIRRYAPGMLAVLGITAYRSAFRHPKATLGSPPEGIGGTRVWVLPNPSGLNAHYQLPELARLFREMREAAEGEGSIPRSRLL